jgi:O-antigen/teichoic acid export membrane protein
MSQPGGEPLASNPRDLAVRQATVGSVAKDDVAGPIPAGAVSGSGPGSVGKGPLVPKTGIFKPAWGRWAWGFVDQGFSSVSNFGLTLLAARLLGPGGLGIVAIGFAFYLVALSIQRTLISQPLIISSSTLARSERSRATASSVTATLALGLAVALVLVGVGSLLGGTIGHGLVAIAPWVLPALVQDHWRAVLFRESRGFAAAANDGVWILGMALSLPLALSLRTSWAVIGCWGLGAAFGGAMGFVQTRVPVAGPIAAWEWVRWEAWPIGRWLAGDGTVYLIVSNITLFVLVAILGTAAMGGYRAASSIFAPLSVLRPAVALPGLPAMTKAVSSSGSKARLVAGKLSGGVVALTGMYLVILGTHRVQLLSLVFGTSFARFAGLILPIGIGEIFLASAVGFSVFLKASREGRPILLSTAVGVIGHFVFASALALRYGLLGAAWGASAAAGLECMCVLGFSLLGSHREPARDAGAVV